jgi:hypothetical protein
MSLINDALKRVGQKRTTPPPGEGIPLQPVADASANGSSTPAILVVILVIAVVGVGGWFVWKKKQANELPPSIAKYLGTNKVAASTNKAGATTNKTVAKVTDPKAAAAAKPGATAPATKPGATAPTAKPGPAPAQTVASTAPGFPTVRLDGIFYRLSKPSALINGKTVYVGDTLQDSTVKIAAIDRTNVTLEFQGHTKVLSLK